MANFDRTFTRLPLAELARIFLARWADQYGQPPTREEAELLFTLLSHEVGHGSSIVQYNWGNVIARDGQDFWWSEWADPEVNLQSYPEDTPKQIARKAKLIRLREDPTAPTRFLALASHEAGADRWLSTLRSKTNQRIIDAAATGNVAKMHKAISTPHPETKMAYCPHCNGGAVLREYEQIRDKIRAAGLFADLKALPASAGEDVEIVGAVAPRVVRRASLLRHSSVWELRFQSEREGDVDTVWNGSEGPAVMLAQAIISRWLTTGPLVVDGRFGEDTHKAVQMFQSSHHLAVDGVIGPKTWRELTQEIQRITGAPR